MTDYGYSTLYGAIMSTEESSGSPSGDKYYFLCESISGDHKSKNKISYYMGGNSFSTRGGGRENQIVLRNIRIIPYSTYDKTQALNNIKLFLDKCTKSAQPPVYLWYINFNDNSPTGRNIELGNNAGVSSATNYMKGYPMDYSWKLEQNIYSISTITFKECLT